MGIWVTMTGMIQCTKLIWQDSDSTVEDIIGKIVGGRKKTKRLYGQWNELRWTIIRTSNLLCFKIERTKQDNNPWRKNLNNYGYDADGYQTMHASLACLQHRKHPTGVDHAEKDKSNTAKPNNDNGKIGRQLAAWRSRTSLWSKNGGSLGMADLGSVGWRVR